MRAAFAAAAASTVAADAAVSDAAASAFVVRYEFVSIL